jgi:hypothetical protein
MASDLTPTGHFRRAAWTCSAGTGVQGYLLELIGCMAGSSPPLRNYLDNDGGIFS